MVPEAFAGPFPRRPGAIIAATPQGWLRNWQRNGWRTAAKKPVENQDLWQDLLAAEEPHEITWELVKGHAGHELNERADELAREAIAEIRAGAHGTGQSHT